MELHGLTEVLTDEGWKCCKDIKEDNMLYSVQTVGDFKGCMNYTIDYCIDETEEPSNTYAIEGKGTIYVGQTISLYHSKKVTPILEGEFILDPISQYIRPTRVINLGMEVTGAKQCAKSGDEYVHINDDYSDYEKLYSVTSNETEKHNLINGMAILKLYNDHTHTVRVSSCKKEGRWYKVYINALVVRACHGAAPVCLIDQKVAERTLA